MSRLIKAAKKRVSSGEDKAKKAESKVKKVSEDTFDFIFRKLDNVSLRKATAGTKKVVREVAASVATDVVADVTGSVKGLVKRLNNVLRTGQEAKRDLVSLASDTANGIAKNEVAAVSQLLKGYQDECDNLLETATRMIKRVRKPGEVLENNLRRTIQAYKTKAQAIEDLFNEFGSLVNKVTTNVAVGDDS